MACLDDATRLGLAVQAFLAHPPIDPLLDPPIPEEIIRQRLQLSVEFLQTIGVLSETENTAIQKYLAHDTLPEPPSGPDLLTTGIVLTSIVLYLHDVSAGSLFGGPLPALHHVVEAATGGALHGGPQAAQACAAIAAMHVLRGVKSSHPEFSAFTVTGVKSAIRNSIGGVKSALKSSIDGVKS
jgi:hypothetical protein